MKRHSLSSLVGIKVQSATAAVFLLGILLLPATTHALTYNVSADNFNATYFGAGRGGWFTGNTSLPQGTTIGPSPLFIDVFLSHLLKADGDLSFGMGGFNPVVANGEVAFTFSLQLFLNGVAVTPASGLTTTNNFGFSVDNIATSYGDSGTAGKNFNEVQIMVTSPTTRGVTYFNTAVGVPEPGVTSLISVGVLGLLAAVYRRRRKAADGPPATL